VGLIQSLQALLDALAGASNWQGTQSILFDGVDEHLLGGDTATLECGDGTTPFSVSLWYKAATDGTTRQLVSKMLSTGDKPGWNVYVDAANDRLVAQIRNSASARIEAKSTATGLILSGTWHHIAVTYDGSKTKAGLTLYLDGSSISVTLGDDTLSTNSPDSGGANFTIAETWEGTSGFPADGNIRDVAFWYNDELTSGEVSTVYNSGAIHNLVAISPRPTHYWELGAAGDDATSGTGQVQDLIGSADLTPTNTEAGDLETDTPPWNGTQSILFDGADEYVTLGDVAPFDCGDGTAAFSVSFWFKNTTFGGDAVVAKNGGNTSPGFQSWVDATGQVNARLYNAAGNVCHVENATTLTAGVWYHAVVTYDGSKAASGLLVYVNAATNANTLSDTLTGDPDPGAVASTIAANGEGASGFYEGNIRDVAWWGGTELSAAQVSTVYNSGAVHDLRNVSPVPDNYWEIGAHADDATSGTGTVQDLIGALDGTPTNTEAGDLEADVP
jgi:hypothetical protein